MPSLTNSTGPSYIKGRWIMGSKFRSILSTMVSRYLAPFPIFSHMTTYENLETGSNENAAKEGRSWEMCLWKELDLGEEAEDFC